MNVMCVVGTRPEAIKMAPIVDAFRVSGAGTRCFLVSTGQHRELLDQALDMFGMEPDIRLDTMKAGQTLPELTGKLMQALDAVVTDVAPQWVLAQGDTMSVFAAGVVSFLRKVHFGHVEAGLRSGDLQQPFPEEMNRRAVDMFGDLLFAPTQHAYDSLLGEGIPSERVLLTGNTVVDAVQMILGNGSLPDGVREPRVRADAPIVVTAHRRENFGEPMREVCRSLVDIHASFPDLPIIYVLHLNPEARGVAMSILGDRDGIELREPMDYREMLELLSRSRLILSDSGGIQEEGATLGKDVLILRNTTERREAIDAGYARLVGCDRQCIVDLTSQYICHGREAVFGPRKGNPFGDGYAAGRIVKAICGSMA